jgi:Tol biopolymer transport system component
VFKRANETLPLPHDLNPKIPEAVERVILKALAREPKYRFASAGEMAAALKTAVSETHVAQAQDTIVRPAPPTPTPPATKSAFSWPWLAGLSAIAVMAVLCLAGLGIGWVNRGWFNATSTTSEAAMLPAMDTATATSTTNPTHTPTPSPPDPTNTPKLTPSATETPTSTDTPTSTLTHTPKPTPTRTRTPTPRPPTSTPSPVPYQGRIAFASDRDGSFEIYTMNADGSNQTRLTNSRGWDTDPAWSPDGERIAFWSARDDPDGEIHIREIYTMNADGSNQTRLTHNLIWNTDPAWSPDGKRIVFRYREDTSGDGVVNYQDKGEIYVMNADGSGQTNLSNNPADDSEPGWSPDGKRITFWSYRNDSHGVYVMNADGSGQTRLISLASAFSGAPVWSPNGEHIAVSCKPESDNYEIYRINSDGSGLTRLTNHPGGNNQNPAWSPDGRHIVFNFRESNRNGQYEIYVINSDGSGLTNLTNHPADDWYPAWGP